MRGERDAIGLPIPSRPESIITGRLRGCRRRRDSPGRLLDFKRNFMKLWVREFIQCTAAQTASELTLRASGLSGVCQNLGLSVEGMSAYLQFLALNPRAPCERLPPIKFGGWRTLDVDEKELRERTRL